MTEKIEVSAHGETGKIEIMEIDIDLLVPTEWNPNELSQDKFNELFNNMAKEGVVDTLTVTPREDGKYTVVGGHHRLEVAKLLGFKKLPCMVKHGMTENDVKFQNMRLNVIHGKINPEKFTKMYEEMAKANPGMDIAREMGIVSPDELSRLLVQTKKSLPPELQETFEKAKDQIKTVDDLVLVLNQLFEKQGSTVEKYHFMILDFEGKESVWIRMKKHDLVNAKRIAEMCFENAVAMDEVFRKMIALLANETPEARAKFCEDMERVEFKELNGKLPTESNISEEL